MGATLLREMTEALRENPALALELRALLAAPPPPPRAVAANLVEFARGLRVGRSKVREWMALGMPHTRSGRTVRIDVERARSWLDSRDMGEMAEARARHDAHKVRRIDDGKRKHKRGAVDDGQGEGRLPHQILPAR
jgi:hypothetical protein